MSTVDQSTQEVIDEIVRMSHGDIDRVRELVDLHPGLAHATGARRTYYRRHVLFFAATRPEPTAFPFCSSRLWPAT